MSDLDDAYAAADAGAESVHDPLPNTGPKADKWPDLPDHDADLGEIRSYLTRAARFPLLYGIEDVHRHGKRGDDPMTVTVRAPGQVRDLRVRFPRQDDASKPATLRTTMARETNGLSRMKHPSQAQAADFFTMLCALASVTENGTEAENTRAWLDEFLGHVFPLTGHSLADPERRFDALQALRARRFERPEAEKFRRGELDPLSLPSLLIDDETGEHWVRASELAAYLRHVHGVRDGLAQPTLDSLLEEIGVSRHYFDVKRESGHPKLVVYCLGVPPEAET